MLSIQQDGTATILTPVLSNTQFEQNYFSPTYLLKENLVTAKKTGRATTYFFSYKQETLVLRHYWRGGLIGKLLSDQYLYLGLKQTRTYQEFALLVKMRALDLPVPEPIAARVVKSGLIYRGDIITKALPNAESLLDILKTRPLSEEETIKAANSIAQFHNAGVNHADLNINNILFSDGDVFLIDFDRGTLSDFSHANSQANMARLARSFDKEKNRNAPFYWQQSDWQILLKGYKEALTG